MSDRVWYLKKCDLLSHLSAEEIGQIEKQSKVRTFAAKNPIYLPADASNCVFLLAQGRIKISHLTPDGKESILAFVEPGELFGESALYENGQRDDLAQALEKSVVVMISSESILSMMQAHADLSLGITKMVGLRRRRIEQRLKTLLFLSNRDKLIHLLLDLAELYGERTPEGIKLGIGLSHRDLASIIGSTRESVTMVLGELQLESLIKVGRKKITLRAIRELAAVVRRRPPRLPEDEVQAPKTTSVSFFSTSPV